MTQARALWLEGTKNTMHGPYRPPRSSHCRPSGKSDEVNSRCNTLLRFALFDRDEACNSNGFINWIPPEGTEPITSRLGRDQLNLLIRQLLVL